MTEFQAKGSLLIEELDGNSVTNIEQDLEGVSFPMSSGGGVTGMQSVPGGGAAGTGGVLDALGSQTEILDDIHDTLEKGAVSGGGGGGFLSGLIGGGGDGGGGGGLLSGLIGGTLALKAKNVLSFGGTLAVKAKNVLRMAGQLALKAKNVLGVGGSLALRAKNFFSLGGVLALSASQVLAVGGILTLTAGGVLAVKGRYDAPATEVLGVTGVLSIGAAGALAVTGVLSLPAAAVIAVTGAVTLGAAEVISIIEENAGGVPNPVHRQETVNPERSGLDPAVQEAIRQQFGNNSTDTGGRNGQQNRAADRRQNESLDINSEHRVVVEDRRDIDRKLEQVKEETKNEVERWLQGGP